MDENKISLLAWTKKHGIEYSVAQRQAVNGLIPALKVGGRWQISENAPPLPATKIICKACGGSFSFISPTHLASHGMTVEEYKQKFPDAEIFSSTVRQKISEVHKGKVVPPEHRAAMSKGRKGVIPKNHPRYEKGRFKATEEAKRNMSRAHMGRVHSEETKRKIWRRPSGQEDSSGNC